MKKQQKKGKKEQKRIRITDENKDKYQEKFMEEYRKDGVSMYKACKVVGFSRQNIYKWAETDPQFAEEFEKLRFIKNKKSEEEWENEHKHDEEYKKKFLEIYADPEQSVRSALKEIDKNLTKKFFDYWLRSDREFKKDYKILQHKTRPRMAEGKDMLNIITSAKMDVKKEKFLHAYIKSLWNVSEACKAVGIKRSTFKGWCRQDPDFKQAIEIAQDEKEDFVQDKLFQLMEQNNPAAVIYATKCLLQKPNEGRRHIYQEQPQPKTINVNIKHDKETIDAVVRAAELSRGDYFDELPTLKSKQLEEENAIDAEYSEEESDAE